MLKGTVYVPADCIESCRSTCRAVYTVSHTLCTMARNFLVSLPVLAGNKVVQKFTIYFLIKKYSIRTRSRAVNIFNTFAELIGTSCAKVCFTTQD